MLILVTTDGSSRSLDVLPHAARLAEVAGAELLLLRVLDPDHDDASAEASAQTLRALAATVPVAASVLVEPRAGRERVGDAILRVAARRRARLIAMASRGTGLVRRALLGSVATDVLGKTPLPLMVTGDQVHPPKATLPYHALVTSDGSPAAEVVLDPLKRVFADTAPGRLRLTLLRVYAAALGDPPRDVAIEKCERDLAAFRRHAPRRFPVDQAVREVVQLGGVAATILAAAGEAGADAIWMATQGYSFSHQVLLGSVALEALGRSELPIVLTRAPR